MTTRIRVLVTGDYRATVMKKTPAGVETVILDGDKEGGRDHFFAGHHEQHFTVLEEPLTDAMKAARPAGFE
jgi:hypothetical protein